MKPQQLIFHDEDREKIRRGVDPLAEAVKVTLGPCAPVLTYSHKEQRNGENMDSDRQCRARTLFRASAADHSLTELIDFVHPQASLSGKASGGDLTGAAGKGHGRTGHAGTQFEPQTEVHAKERARFARELADYLNEGVAAQKCNALVLVASSPMLGELRPCLSRAAEKAVTRSIAGDLTRYVGPELRARIDDALLLPD